MKHQIKKKYTGDVLFECELPADTPSVLATRYVLEKAVQSNANLSDADLMEANLMGANLRDANLTGANLQGAYMITANLSNADLMGADLLWADLSRANLTGANLSGANMINATLSKANLTGANLQGANLQGAKLIGNRPYFQIGPIGSRCDYFTALITDEGLKLQAGCFFGTVEEFSEKLIATHADNDHAKEYRMALMMIEAHAAIWTPKEANNIKD